MTRRYLTVLAVGLVAGILLIALARRAPVSEQGAVNSTPASVELIVRVLEGKVEVSDSVLAQGVRVRLTVENATRQPVTLSLGGYEDRVRFEALAAGASDTLSFVTDRPGERFPWLREGTPVARLEISGSHLIEGHR